MSLNNRINNKNYKPLTPFKGWVLENFPFIESDFDCITNYQLICKLTEYLNNVISNQNQVQELGTELVNGYNTLLDYVNNYFDNLDVQEEINNKLDDLVEDGTLENLIGAYIQPRIDEQNENISNFENSVTNRLNSQDNLISSVRSGSPLVATSTSGMTDTTRIYVNTTDGNWYYYNGTSWEIGGTYQSSRLARNVVEPYNTTFLQTGKQLFNKNNVVDGYYIQGSTGNIIEDNTCFYTEYIPVKSSTNYYFDNYDVNTRMIYYDSSKTYISGHNLATNVFTTPANAVYIRFSALKISKWKIMLSEGNTAEDYEYFKYYINNLDIEKYNNIEEYQTTFIKHGNQLFSKETATLYYYKNYNNGEIATNTNYYYSDYIKVDGNTDYYVSNVSTIQVCFYDINKNFITGGNSTIFTNNILTTPPQAEFMVISHLISAIDTQMVAKSSSSVPYETYQTYIDGLNIKDSETSRIFYVGANRTITKLKDGIELATQYQNSIVYVDAGNYNLVSEFGQSTLDNYTQSNHSKGLMLKNNVKVIFSANAKVTFNYTGTNYYVHTEFSPFNFSYVGGGGTLENLDLECSNCRYCIHDDQSNGNITNAYINTIKGCRFSLDNSNNADWNYQEIDIGGGMGYNGIINIENCYFDKYSYYHQNAGNVQGSKTIINLKNNYSLSTFRFTNNYSNINVPSYVYATNNSVTSAITIDDGAGTEMVKLYAWNNEIR